MVDWARGRLLGLGAGTYLFIEDDRSESVLHEMGCAQPCNSTTEGQFSMGLGVRGDGLYPDGNQS